MIYKITEQAVDALIDLLDGWLGFVIYPEIRTYTEKTITALKNIEKYELVTCKDCKWSELDDPDFPDQYLCHADGDAWNKGNHWCSYAERKEE